MAHTHGIGTTVPTSEGKYAPEYIQAFQREDRHAARAVILLMSCVFSIGLAGSIAVCSACWPNPTAVKETKPTEVRGH